MPDFTSRIDQTLENARQMQEWSVSRLPIWVISTEKVKLRFGWLFRKRCVVCGKKFRATSAWRIEADLKLLKHRIPDHFLVRDLAAPLVIYVAPDCVPSRSMLGPKLRARSTIKNILSFL